MLRNSKVLRLLAVVFLVPIVVFSNSATAAAATSGIMRFQFTAVEYQGYNVIGANCQIPWASNSTGMILSAKAICVGGPDYTPGACQSFEPGCGSYGLILKDLYENTCGSAALENTEAPGNGIASTKTLLTGGFIGFEGLGDCVPVEACLAYYWDGFGPGAQEQVACTAVDIDPVEGPESACSHGTPATIRSEWVIADNQQYWTDWHLVTYVNGVKIGSAGAPHTGEGTEGWNFTVFYMDPQRSYSPSELMNIEAPATFWPNENLHGNGHYGFYRVSKDPGGEAPTNEPDRLAVLGVEVAYGGSPPRVLYGYNRSNDGKLLDAGSIARRLPTAGDHAYGGITDPALCRFWFGQKVTNIEGSDMDEPFGEVPDPGVEEPPVEPPEPEEPPEGNWLYLIWLALTRLISVVAGLAATIAAAVIAGITDAFESLFVPNPNKWKVSQLHDQLQSKPPFSVAESLADQAGDTAEAFQGSGNCGVLLNFGPDTSVSCSEVRNAPGMGALYNLVTFGIISLTGLGGFRMVSSHFQDGQ